jgi:hypothetical protein
MSIKKTYSVLTTVLLEHNYINFFVEYHIKLGFNKIYVLIDNIDYEQEEYIIENEEYKEKVIFFYCTNYITNKQKINWPRLYGHKSEVVHYALQKLYKDVEEDYTILLGIDSFLFLNNLTIQEYFVKFNITDDISQIFFKWVNLYNKTLKLEYNLLKNINNNCCKKQYISTYFTLGNRKLVTEPSSDSHHYYFKNTTSKAFFDNKIYNISNTDTFLTILDKIKPVTNYENTKDGCIYHFLIRDYIDPFIKTYYYWSSNKDKDILKKNIYNSINGEFKKIGNRLDFFLVDDYFKICEISINIENNTYIFNEKYINLLLEECNITKTQFLNFFDKISTYKNTNFNYEYYIKKYHDLRNMTQVQALLHWNKYGKKEGRICNPSLE